MAALFNLLTEKIIISRLAVISGDKRGFATLTSEYCNVQRMAEEKALGLGGAIGKMYRIYAGSSANIQSGDMLKDADGNKYRVVGITIPASLGSFIHKEGIIEMVE